MDTGAVKYADEYARSYLDAGPNQHAHSHAATHRHAYSHQHAH